MKVADWIGVAVIGGGLVVGGAYLLHKRGMFNGNAVLPGGPQQYTPPAGPVISVAPQNNTLSDVKTGIAVAKEGLAALKDLASSFSALSESF